MLRTDRIGKYYFSAAMNYVLLPEVRTKYCFVWGILVNVAFRIIINVLRKSGLTIVSCIEHKTTLPVLNKKE